MFGNVNDKCHFILNVFFFFFHCAVSECFEEISMVNKSSGGTRYITSPGWPHGYDVNLNCSWLISSPIGTHLSLRFLAVNVEEAPDCIADSVAVYSGNAVASTRDATLLRKVCESNTTQEMISGTNLMTVKFITDSYLNMTGFKAIVYKGNNNDNYFHHDVTI